jgi:putative redox protein
MLSSKDSPKHRLLSERAASRDLLALRFDFSGRGESEGDPEALTVSQEVDDLRAAVATVRARGAHQVALVGSSLGGTVAVLVAAEDPGITALATVACPAKVPDHPRPGWSAQEVEGGRVEVAPGTFISAEFFRDGRRHDVLGAASRIRCPWLIVHGAEDELIPADEASRLAAATSAARLIVHPEADHRFSTDQLRGWLIDQVLEFVTQELNRRSRHQKGPGAAGSC